MSIEAGAEKRRGKRIIGERRRSVSQTSTVILEGYTIDEAFNLFLRVKEAENVKPRTRKEYDVQYRYFMEWLEGYAPDVTCIEDITTSMIRDYIYYLAHEKTKYEGNPYKKDEYKQEKGLSPYTINIRIRFLKSWFNKYAKKAGIKKTVSPHSFRRFYAKQCTLNGMDIFTLQRTLGHADISTTRKYIQLEKEDLIRQHNLYSPLQRIRNRK